MRLNVRSNNTFHEALEMVDSHIKSRQVTVPSGRTDHQGQTDMEIGALKGIKGWGKNNEMLQCRMVFGSRLERTGMAA